MSYDEHTESVMIFEQMHSSFPRTLLQGFAAPPQAYELLRSLLRFAHAVHGGSLAASRAGWQAPTVSNAAAAAADPQLHRCRRSLMLQSSCSRRWPAVGWCCCAIGHSICCMMSDQAKRRTCQCVHIPTVE